VLYDVYKRSLSTYDPNNPPVSTSVYWAKSFSERKQWKLKGNKLGSFPLSTLSCHCLKEKPRRDVTSFCKQHYIEWPSESQCLTENPLSNWDKRFMKRLITVWFNDLSYTTTKQNKSITSESVSFQSLDITTWFFLQTRVQAISDVLVCHYRLHDLKMQKWHVPQFRENRWGFMEDLSD